MQRSTGYIKTKGQVSGLISGVRPVEFKIVTHNFRLVVSEWPRNQLGIWIGADENVDDNDEEVYPSQEMKFISASISISVQKSGDDDADHWTLLPLSMTM